MPLLYITPGNTSFMGGTTENYRTALLGSLGDRAPGAASAEDALTETSLETMLGEYNGKLYTIMPAYTEYFKYVNPLCRAGAIFLDISEKSLIVKMVVVVINSEILTGVLMKVLHMKSGKMKKIQKMKK